MGGIESVVDVERDAAWHLAEAGAVEPDHGLAHAQQVTRSGQVLEPRDGQLRAQRGTIRQPAEGELEGRVVPQAVGVVAVLIADANHQYPELQDVDDAMHDPPRRAGIGHAGGQAVSDTEAAFDLAQRQHAGI